MEQDHTLRLIVVEESRNDAEALANVLRNAGQASRLTYVDSTESLATALDAEKPDLILCATGLEAAPLPGIVELVAQRELHIPLVAIGESGDESAIIAAMRQGANDLCSYDQPEHLQLVVRRELAQLLESQHAQDFELRFRESEKRARMLMESSRDAIAYIHEGMHVFANSSYLEMFGFENLEGIEGTPILDIVSPDDHAECKEFLRNFGKDGASEGDMRTHGVLPDGKVFDAVMELAVASIDGEPCTQIIIRTQPVNNKELEQKLKFLTKQDVVTGLFNRQYFMEDLELAVTNAVTGTESAALLYVLLDNFKNIKDNVGIAAADSVIGEIAALIREHTGETDIAARFGRPLVYRPAQRL